MDPQPPADKLLDIGFLPEEVKTAELYEPVDCPRCMAGYKGRFAVLDRKAVERVNDQILRRYGVPEDRRL